MLSVEGLTKSFGVRVLWRDLTFDASPGTMTAVVGPSGCGKSTLLNCVGLLEKPDAGSIRFAELDLLRLSRRGARRFRRHNLGYLFQNYALVDNATVARNLDFATGTVWPWSRRSYVDDLASVGLADKVAEKVHHLSGGEQQRVSLARLLVKRPTLILADEPTGSLDEPNAVKVLAIMRGLAENGAAILVATHSAAVVEACDDVLDLGRSPSPSPC